ncbi:hypothetical protein [Mycolicibacterium gadium]|uniref:hypothetical protein n=1 Tax=Mycolicibacterium gadium TaxID=1794 RepID=UPI002FDC86FA
MRPVGDRRLVRCDIAPEVAVNFMAIRNRHVSNLLLLQDMDVAEHFWAPGIDMLRVEILPGWDGMADGGGYGGGRHVSLVSEPVIAA